MSEFGSQFLTCHLAFLLFVYILLMVSNIPIRTLLPLSGLSKATASLANLSKSGNAFPKTDFSSADRPESRYPGCIWWRETRYDVSHVFTDLMVTISHWVKSQIRGQYTIKARADTLPCTSW